MIGSHKLVSARYGFEHVIFGFATNALALNGHVEESLGAEVSHVPERRFHYWASR